MALAAVSGLTPKLSAADGEGAAFDDRLGDNWRDLSWKTTVNFANANPVRTGSRSIAVTFERPYAGLSLRAVSPIDARPYNALGFWAHGGTAGARFAVSLQATASGFPPGS